MASTNIRTRPAILYYLLLTMCNPALILAVNECLFLYEIEENPYLQFPIRPGLTCWEFCKHLPNCTAISFQYDRSGLCRFYNLQDSNPNYPHEVYEMIYTGRKDCLLGRDTQDVLKNGATKDGILLQQQETGACLRIRPVQSSEEGKWLMWIEDCRDASLWLIERLNDTTKGDVVKITDTSSKRCISTISSRNRYETKVPLVMVVMKSCSDTGEQEFIMAPVNRIATLAAEDRNF